MSMALKVGRGVGPRPFDGGRKRVQPHMSARIRERASSPAVVPRTRLNSLGGISSNSRTASSLPGGDLVQVVRSELTAVESGQVVRAPRATARARRARARAARTCRRGRRGPACRRRRALRGRCWPGRRTFSSGLDDRGADPRQSTRRIVRSPPFGIPHTPSTSSPRGGTSYRASCRARPCALGTTDETEVLPGGEDAHGLDPDLRGEAETEPRTRRTEATASPAGRAEPSWRGVEVDVGWHVAAGHDVGLVVTLPSPSQFTGASD